MNKAICMTSMFFVFLIAAYGLVELIAYTLVGHALNPLGLDPGRIFALFILWVVLFSVGMAAFDEEWTK